MSNKGETFLRDTFFNEIDDIFVSLDIHTAASLGDVSFFMKYDVGELASSLSVSNISGWTPLMYACAKGHSLLVNYLLMSGAKRTCKSNSGVTPLMLAISSGDLTTVESIFSTTNLEETDYRNWTPLFYAVHFTREKCLNYLLSKGANVDIVDYQNETPLMVAIKLGRETMVESILKTAKNLDVISYKQESALMLANESNNSKIQSLVKKSYEFLKNQKNKLGELKGENKTPLRNPRLSPQHFSPTPLKQQLKLQLSQIRMNKSYTYSPNKALKSTPQKSKKLDLNVSPSWKLSFPKKYWSPQLRPHNDVQQFLKTLGLEKYWPLFRDEEVDFETLLTLNEENLKELGIILFGPRKKIFLAIQQIRNFY